MTRLTKSAATVASLQEVERIWQLEGHLGIAAVEITLLVAHIRDDDKALLGNLGARRDLVTGHRPDRIGVAHVKVIARDSGITGLVEVLKGKVGGVLVVEF